MVTFAEDGNEVGETEEIREKDKILSRHVRRCFQEHLMIFLNRNWLDAQGAQRLIMIQPKRFTHRRLLVELGQASQRIDD